MTGIVHMNVAGLECAKRSPAFTLLFISPRSLLFSRVGARYN
jgi:hypothetical protein